MQIYYFEDRRRLFLAIILSMILHLCIFISTEIRYRFPWTRHKADTARRTELISFELIREEPLLIMETPDIKEEIPSRRTNILSDKNIVTRDMLEKEAALTDMPYAEGRSKLKEMRKEIPQIASVPITKSEPSHEVKQPQVVSSEKGEERIIELAPSEQKVPQELLRREDILQPDQIASLPKDSLRIPLYDDRLSNARGFGEVTFNAKKHDAAPYVIKMKKKIEEYWAPPVIFTYYGLTSGETVIQFKIMPDGSVRDLKVIAEKGDESLKKASVRAIMDAGPFEPIPPQLLADEKDKFLGITFTFYYIIDNLPST